jgi:hypothetical protein
MKRTTVFLPEDLERDLYAYAKRTGKPAAVVVREAIAAYIANDERGHALPSFVGAFDSGHADTADRHDELLFRALTPHADAPGRTLRTGRRRTAAPRRSR